MSDLEVTKPVVLIIGGAGFIGNTLARKIQDSSLGKVLILDSFIDEPYPVNFKHLRCAKRNHDQGINTDNNFYDTTCTYNSIDIVETNTDKNRKSLRDTSQGNIYDTGSTKILKDTSQGNIYDADTKNNLRDTSQGNIYDTGYTKILKDTSQGIIYDADTKNNLRDTSQGNIYDTGYTKILKDTSQGNIYDADTKNNLRDTSQGNIYDTGSTKILKDVSKHLKNNNYHSEVLCISKETSDEAEPIHLDQSPVKIIYGDATNTQLLVDLIRTYKINIIYHLAAQPGVRSQTPGLLCEAFKSNVTTLRACAMP
jgi:hypothetical protein